MVRVYLKRYKTCTTSAEISTMQDKIIEELERAYEDSRKEKGPFPWADVVVYMNPIVNILTEDDGEPEDLLHRNPNHQHDSDDDKSDRTESPESLSGSEEESEVEYVAGSKRP
jgi:pre-rRNA-processing protein TSR3